MRALGDPDAFPATDLGLLHALRAHGLPTDVRDRAERWRPWRAYAILHLWTSLGSTATSEEPAA
jgi:AraC family transcriptional regulator of adaptative response / DNA-3-methyladenine glycosylase II